MNRSYTYFVLSTRSGKVLARGPKKTCNDFAKIWITGSPFYDPQDPLILEEESYAGDDGRLITRKIVKEF